jgi:hypothetical protein
VGGLGDNFSNAVRIWVVDEDFETDFGDEVDGVFGSSVDLGVTFLATVTACFTDSHATDSSSFEC